MRSSLCETPFNIPNISMMKKDLLDRYKRETEQCFIPEGSSMSAEQVVQLLQEPYLTVNLSTPSWTKEDR